MLATWCLTALALAGTSKHDRILAEAVAADDLPALQGELRSRDDQTALLLRAASAGAARVTGWLLEQGVSVQASGPCAEASEPSTPLLCALERGHADVVDLLLARGADLRASDAQGRTVLHLAAGAGRDDLVPAALAAGVDPRARDGQGRTAADLLEPCGDHRPVYEQLVTLGAADAGRLRACEGVAEGDVRRLVEVAELSERAQSASGRGHPPDAPGWRPLAERALAEVAPGLSVDDVVAVGFAAPVVPACTGGRWCRAKVETDSELLCRSVAVVLASAEAGRLLAAGVKATAPRVRLDCTGQWVDVKVDFPGNTQALAELEHFRGTTERLWVDALTFARPAP